MKEASFHRPAGFHPSLCNFRPKAPELIPDIRYRVELCCSEMWCDLLNQGQGRLITVGPALP